MPINRKTYFYVSLERNPKDKTGTSITAVSKSLFKNRKRLTIQSDNGTGSVDAAVQQYWKRQGVSFHRTHNPDIKGAIIEYFNRTLKPRCINISPRITHTVTWAL
jgi:hypothetical protein